MVGIMTQNHQIMTTVDMSITRTTLREGPFDFMAQLEPHAACLWAQPQMTFGVTGNTSPSKHTSFASAATKEELTQRMGHHVTPEKNL